MNLLKLAPNVQKEILFLPHIVQSRYLIHERTRRLNDTVLGWDKLSRMCSAENLKVCRQLGLRSGTQEGTS